MVFLQKSQSFNVTLAAYQYVFMTPILLVTFVIGYLAIALEHPIKINKTATALLTGVICWTLYIVSGISDTHLVKEGLSHHLAQISDILFFLLGAMTIVELVDAHQGFKVITDLIRTRSVVKLMWVVSLLTFFLSAVLDNLTTSIVMVSLLRKIIHDSEKRKWFAGLVIISANSGGAWSPIGDVTTTMLWIGGQITALNIMKLLIIPSLVSVFVPLVYLTVKLKNEPLLPEIPLNQKDFYVPDGSKLMFYLGISSLLFVPVFKTLTHLPPYMGILLSLGVLWVASEIIHKDKDESEKKPYSASHALSKIDAASVLFFLGILLSIGSLESTGILSNLAGWMNESIGNMDLIVTAIGLVSAVVDNVPLVAASMAMYPLGDGIGQFAVDSKLWEMLAFCAGTGGSVLIIGSAAGVAVMGMEKIDFMWYLKKISLLALLGYFAGTACYLLIYSLLGHA